MTFGQVQGNARDGRSRHRPTNQLNIATKEKENWKKKKNRGGEKERQVKQKKKKKGKSKTKKNQKKKEKRSHSAFQASYLYFVLHRMRHISKHQMANHGVGTVTILSEMISDLTCFFKLIPKPWNQCKHSQELRVNAVEHWETCCEIPKKPKTKRTMRTSIQHWEDGHMICQNGWRNSKLSGRRHFSIKRCTRKHFSWTTSSGIFNKSGIETAKSARTPCKRFLQKTHVVIQHQSSCLEETRFLEDQFGKSETFFRRSQGSTCVVITLNAKINSVCWVQNHSMYHSKTLTLSNRRTRFCIHFSEAQRTIRTLMVTMVKYKFIKNHFHQNPLSSKNHFHQNATFIKNQFHQKPISSKTLPVRGTHHPSKNKIIRVCVKASRAEGPRRLHTNTACAHLGVSTGLFCWTLPAEGRQCSPERPAEGPKVGVQVLGFRV